MIASRARAMTLLGASFALGLIVGGASLAMAARSGRAGWMMHRGGPRANPGYANRVLMRTLHFDLSEAQRDSINAIWCRGELAMDSIRMPIKPATDSLFQSVRPRIDSLFQSIRPAVETRRAETRNAIRALLTPADQQRYDSMNRADDEQRKKAREQPGSPPGPCSTPPGGPGPRGGFDHENR